MKDNSQFNINQCCSIRTLIRRINSKYDWFEYQKKTFWNKEQKEGFYYWPDWDKRTYITEEEILKNNKDVFCEDKIIYYKPFLEFKMNNGEYFTRFFETESELNEFLNRDKINQIPWIK